MFNNGKKAKQLKNQMFRRIQFLMTRNFFTIEEFRKLKYRRALKVIKLIAKAEGIKINKIEQIELVEFICSNKTSKITSTVQKLFTFITEVYEVLSSKVINSLVKLISFVFIFRINMQKVLRV